jgi:ankyrin repeat protein
MQYFHNFKKSIVFIGLLTIHVFSFSGSYEDFFKAVKTDNVKVVQSLLKRGFDANTVNPDGVPGLMLALREPSLQVADLLVTWPQTRVEFRNQNDESPLMLASLKGYLPLVKKLVERDADVNKPGWTPLHYAATGGHLSVIEHLLENSAYIDAESPNGSTPLMLAAMYGSPESVKLLIQAGADLTIKNQLGMTALDFATKGNRRNSQELIQTGLERLAARKARSNAAASSSTAGTETPEKR